MLALLLFAAPAMAQSRLQAAMAKAQTQLLQLKLAEAERGLQRALKSEPKAPAPLRAKALGLLGWILAEARQPAAAKSQFDAALRLDPAVKLPPEASPKLRKQLDAQRRAMAARGSGRGRSSKVGAGVRTRAAERNSKAGAGASAAVRNSKAGAGARAAERSSKVGAGASAAVRNSEATMNRPWVDAERNSNAGATTQATERNSKAGVGASAAEAERNSKAAMNRPWVEPVATGAERNSKAGPTTRATERNSKAGAATQATSAAPSPDPSAEDSLLVLPAAAAPVAPLAHPEAFHPPPSKDASLSTGQIVLIAGGSAVVVAGLVWLTLWALSPDASCSSQKGYGCAEIHVLP